MRVEEPHPPIRSGPGTDSQVSGANDPVSMVSPFISSPGKQSLALPPSSPSQPPSPASLPQKMLLGLPTPGVTVDPLPVSMAAWSQAWGGGLASSQRAPSCDSGFVQHLQTPQEPGDAEWG